MNELPSLKVRTPESKTSKDLNEMGEKAIASVGRQMDALVQQAQDVTVSTIKAQFPARTARDLEVSFMLFTQRLKHSLEEAEKQDFSTLLVLFHEATEFYKSLENLRKQLNGILTTYDRAVIPATFDRLDQDKVQVPSIGRSFYPSTKYSASIVDKEAGFEWLEKQGDGDLITRTVNAGTLASYLRGYEEDNGKSAPEEIFKLSTYQKTGSSKYTPKS